MLFQKFTSVRSKLESTLVTHKDLIATILQKHISRKRVEKYKNLLDELIDRLVKNASVSESDLIEMAGLDGKIVVGNSTNGTKGFSNDVKSKVFINNALFSAMKCALCDGYLDVEKSVSYDHVVEARNGGLGSPDNCHLTHPFCNQSRK